MKEIKFGAIDIGSNAARLLITSVTGLEEGEEAYFKKAALVRSPLRLGFDAFVEHNLSPRSIDRLVNSMIAYKHLMSAYEVESYRACATSAMRESQNSAEIVAIVKERTGIEIEVIPGHTEAQMVYSTQIAKKLKQDRPYLYIDVGGGSTEVSLFYNGQISASKSFKIGTIRLLKDLVTPDKWAEMEAWITENVHGYVNLASIGLGGNINKIFKISNKAKDTPLMLFELKRLYKELEGLTLSERIRLYDMKTDRADVILPAAQIFTNVMTWANCQEIFVPKVGLADGITQYLYKEYLDKI